MKKFIYLFLALLLPGTFYVFLKYAGKNEFHIPTYYEQGVPDSLGCGIAYPAPYRVADSLRRSLSIDSTKAGVIFFHDPAITTAASTMAELRSEFGSSIALRDIQELYPDEGVYHAMYELLKYCVMISRNQNQVVLVDQNGTIRGYYDFLDRKDLDRLRVEIKILLQQ